MTKIVPIKWMPIAFCFGSISCAVLISGIILFICSNTIQNNDFFSLEGDLQNLQT